MLQRFSICIEVAPLRLRLSYSIHFSSQVTILFKNGSRFRRSSSANEICKRAPFCIAFNSCGTQRSSFLTFPISLMALQIVDLSTFMIDASSFKFVRGFSSTFSLNFSLSSLVGGRPLSLFSMSVSHDRNLANHSCARWMVTTSSSYALFSHLAASVAESWFLKQRRRPNRICVLSILMMFSLRLQISNDKCISIAHQIKEDKMTNTMTKTESKKVDKQERYD